MHVLFKVRQWLLRVEFGCASRMGHKLWACLWTALHTTGSWTNVFCGWLSEFSRNRLGRFQRESPPTLGDQRSLRLETSIMFRFMNEDW